MGNGNFTNQNVGGNGNSAMLQKDGNIAREMMYNTYNMGIGMMLTLDEKDADAAKKAIESAGYHAFAVGETSLGEKGIELL